MYYTNADRIRSIIAGREEAVGKPDAIIRLGDTDTAWNPEDTKEFIQGPGRVKYQKTPEGQITFKIAR